MKKTYKRKVQQSFVGEMQLNQQIVPVAFTAYEVADGTVRFRVSIDQGPVHIFALDSNHQQYELIDGSAIDPLSAQAIGAVNQLLQKRIAA